PEQRQKIPALEMRAFFLELRASLGVHETGGGIRELVPWIVLCGLALRFDKDRPARSKATQRVVEPGRDRDEFRLCSGVQVRPAEPRSALERAILVEDDALPDPRR